MLRTLSTTNTTHSVNEKTVFAQHFVQTFQFAFLPNKRKSTNLNNRKLNEKKEFEAVYLHLFSNIVFVMLRANNTQALAKGLGLFVVGFTKDLKWIDRHLESC